MKIEDASLKDLIFFLALVLLLAVPGTWINVIMKNDVASIILIVGIIVTSSKLLKAIFKKLQEK